MAASGIGHQQLVNKKAPEGIFLHPLLWSCVAVEQVMMSRQRWSSSAEVNEIHGPCWDTHTHREGRQGHLLGQPAETLLLIEPHSLITLQLVGGDMSSDVMLLCSTCVFC